MITGSIVLVFMVMILIIYSIRERVRLRREYRDKAWDVTQGKASPLSEALTGLIGTAGGIYLSLVTFFSFLELQMPPRVEIFKFNLEPLAAISLSLAIMQPFVVKLMHRFKGIR